MKTHVLKCETEYFKDVSKGMKKFELRKNDRDFKVDDFITLHETISGNKTGKYAGPLRIKYILDGGVFGLDKDYCILNW